MRPWEQEQEIASRRPAKLVSFSVPLLTAGGGGRLFQLTVLFNIQSSIGSVPDQLCWLHPWGFWRPIRTKPWAARGAPELALLLAGGCSGDLLWSLCPGASTISAYTHLCSHAAVSISLTTYSFSPEQGIMMCLTVNLWIGSSTAFTHTMAGSRGGPGRLLGFYSLRKSKNLPSPCTVCAFGVFYPTKAWTSNKFLLKLGY